MDCRRSRYDRAKDGVTGVKCCVGNGRQRAEATYLLAEVGDLLGVSDKIARRCGSYLDVGEIEDG